MESTPTTTTTTKAKRIPKKKQTEEEKQRKVEEKQRKKEEKERKKKEKGVRNEEKKKKKKQDQDKSVEPERDPKKVKVEEQEAPTELLVEDEDLEAIDDVPENEDFQTTIDQKLHELSKMTPDQYQRYLYYRRSAIDRKAIKRQMALLSNAQVSSKLALTMAGITKMYLTDIMEEARSIMADSGEQGPVRPHHIQEAYRRISQTQPKNYLLYE